MEWLKYEELIFEKNKNLNFANKKKSLSAFGNILLYRLENLRPVTLPADYYIDFKDYKVNLFTLETLRDIISIVERVRKKGIKKPIIFCTNTILVFSDDLTVSLTEYVIYYYFAKCGLNVYITYGEMDGKDIRFGFSSDEMKVHNGFFLWRSRTRFL